MIRKHRLGLAGILLAAITLWQCGPPKPAATENEQKAPKQYTIAQFMNTTRLTGSAFSPDESKVMFTSNQSGIFNAYEVAVASGKPKQLTESKTNSAYAISYFPADERLLFASDNGGNEITNIYRKDTDGKITNLTPDTVAKAEFQGWSFDRKSFFYVSNKRNPQFFDLYEMDIASFNSRLAYKNEQGLDVGTISDNKRYLALTKSITTSNSDIYLYDTKTSQTKLITRHTGEVANNPQTFSPDNKKLYFTTDEGSEFAYVKSYELATGKMEKVAEESWDIVYMYFSRTGKYRVIGINNDAKTEIKIQNTADN